MKKMREFLNLLNRKLMYFFKKISSHILTWIITGYLILFCYLVAENIRLIWNVRELYTDTQFTNPFGQIEFEIY